MFRQNNVYISAFIITKPTTYFYLSLFTAQEDKDKPRAKKGEANFYLCELIKLFIKNKKLSLSDDFKLVAGDLEGDPSHDQEALEKYYMKLGFKEDGEFNEDGQPMKQTIKGFLNNCKKFDGEKTPIKKTNTTVSDISDLSYDFVEIYEKEAKKLPLSRANLGGNFLGQREYNLLIKEAIDGFKKEAKKQKFKSKDIEEEIKENLIPSIFDINENILKKHSTFEQVYIASNGRFKK